MCFPFSFSYFFLGSGNFCISSKESHTILYIWQYQYHVVYKQLYLRTPDIVTPHPISHQTLNDLEHPFSSHQSYHILITEKPFIPDTNDQLIYTMAALVARASRISMYSSSNSFIYADPDCQETQPCCMNLSSLET